jgi:hypothetical protein
MEPEYNCHWCDKPTWNGAGHYAEELGYTHPNAEDRICEECFNTGFKKVTITQTYELAVSYEVVVPRDMTDETIIEQFGEMEIGVTVDEWEETRDGHPMGFVGVDYVATMGTYITETQEE